MELLRPLGWLRGCSRGLWDALGGVFELSDCFRGPLGAKRQATGGPRSFQAELKRRLEQTHAKLAESSIFMLLFDDVVDF